MLYDENTDRLHHVKFNARFAQAVQNFHHFAIHLGMLLLLNAEVLTRHLV